MTTPTGITDLLDDILVKIFWPSSRPSSSSSEADPSWIPLWPTPKYLYGVDDAQEVLSVAQTSVIPLPLSPAADAAHHLLIASICSRWRDLAKRHVATLLVKKDCVVSRQDLANAVSCFPNLTHLHLCDHSVEALDDVFLAHLASSCPKLTALHVGEHNRVDADCDDDSRNGEHLLTECGLDRFFRRCPHLEHLSLYCLGKGPALPVSLFQLPHLRTLLLDHPTGRMAPFLTGLTCLTSLSIDSGGWTCHQLSTLVLLTTLTSLSLSHHIILESEDPPFAAFSQLPSLRSLRFGLQRLRLNQLDSSPQFSRMFQSESSCSLLERLKLTYCHELHRFPDHIGQLLPRLKKLSICFCRSLVHLSEQFTSLTSLQSLIISECSVSSLPENFGNLPVLKTLVLHGLPLENLPESFCQLASLETLFIIRCWKIQELPLGFGHLPVLQSLCLKHLPLLDLPEDIGLLVNLHTFVLDNYYGQKRLPSSFTQLSSLTRIEINLCGIAELPEHITALARLETLRIQSCRDLSSAPANFGGLTRLKQLKISRDLETLPLFLRGLKNQLKGLKQLEPGRDLETLPLSLEDLRLGSFDLITPLPAIPVLSGLTKLKLIRVRFPGGLADGEILSGLKHLKQLKLVLADDATKFLSSLSCLSDLRTLTISSAGSMRELPEFVASAVQQLRQLGINMGGELRELPANITTLQRLTSIRIHAPKLSSLPDGIGALSRLRKLDLSKCSSLAHLPASLTQLSCLHELNLSNTSILSLPRSFSRLTRLKRLNLQGCKQLGCLPEDLAELKMLNDLDTNGCDRLPRDQDRRMVITLDVNGVRCCSD
ncbi:hypothetical protein CLOM_g826 [Closterium sp. NIES-68]|nr:hypothetical protein CLOM_g826 [Closterium sp. NIES-68]GJP71284.1 hypothetical protein CLOP_g2133 [Closterium sp. NIES-67]